MNSLSQYLELYQANAQDLDSHAPELMNSYRPETMAWLADARLPEKGDEGHPSLSLNQMFAPNYGVNVNRLRFAVNPAESFHCGVPNISTMLGIVANDIFCPTSSLQRNLPQGVTMMSLAHAAKENPALVEKYYNQQVARHSDAAAHLNTLLCQDGVLLHVAAGVEVDKPLQLVNIFNAPAPMMGVRRLLIILEAGAKASLLVCDHSVNRQQQYLSNQVAEIFLEENAQFDYYDLEESSLATSRCSALYAWQGTGSSLTCNGTTLMGGMTYNSYAIEHGGEHAETRLAGMAIAAENQLVDNLTQVHHSMPKCHSDQMFKYILEDQAQGSFFGKIVVDEKAKYTKAYQSNRNVLASSDAKMYTRPQLEIYCDEVKCSHGATVGQLDANALFYMRSRGIPETEARMMLMQAFMADVIDTVSIPALKSRLGQLVEQRLSGNKQLCADCKISE